jgi:uncharacterized phage protein (TIGR01671 family)
MREILFRGKTKDGDWVYWNELGEINFDLTDIEISLYVHLLNDELMFETVGQFTGLTDKNGTKIFEGDIVVTRYTNGKICSIGDIKFDCGVFGAEWTVHKKHKTMVGGWGQLHNLRRLDDDIINHIEVIGNIHDNPELLTE